MLDKLIVSTEPGYVENYCCKSIDTTLKFNKYVLL